MADKDGKSSKEKAEFEEIDDDEIDFVNYFSEPNIRGGTQYRKKIVFEMYGKTMKVAIRPITQLEMNIAQENEKMGNGTGDESIVHMACYSMDGKQLPFSVIQDKIPGGFITFLATEIIKFSGFGITAKQVDELKKP